MNTIESLQALKEGKKVRSKEWAKNIYIYFKNGNIFYHDGSSYDRVATLKVTGENFHKNKYELYIEQILDKDEKAYLENVIRPFKDKVFSITKRRGAGGEFLNITMKNDSPLIFPYFDENAMYQEMKRDIPYSVQELGLFK